MLNSNRLQLKTNMVKRNVSGGYYTMMSLGSLVRIQFSAHHFFSGKIRCSFKLLKLPEHSSCLVWGLSTGWSLEVLSLVSWLRSQHVMRCHHLQGFPRVPVRPQIIPHQSLSWFSSSGMRWHTLLTCPLEQGTCQITEPTHCRFVTDVQEKEVTHTNVSQWGLFPSPWFCSSHTFYLCFTREHGPSGQQFYLLVPSQGLEIRSLGKRSERYLQNKATPYFSL